MMRAMYDGNFLGSIDFAYIFLLFFLYNEMISNKYLLIAKFMIFYDLYHLIRSDSI